MNQKTRYTREDVESINARLMDAVRTENERLTIAKVLTEITPTIRQMRETGMSKTRICAVLKEAGIAVPVRLVSSVLSETALPKRHYRPRKQSSSDLISIESDTCNEAEKPI
ncbi:MAG: hypothetical protein ACYCXG_00245 [Acidiferrobacter sp.]